MPNFSTLFLSVLLAASLAYGASMQHGKSRAEHEAAVLKESLTALELAAAKQHAEILVTSTVAAQAALTKKENDHAIIKNACRTSIKAINSAASAPDWKSGAKSGAKKESPEAGQQIPAIMRTPLPHAVAASLGSLRETLCEQSGACFPAAERILGKSTAGGQNR